MTDIIDQANERRDEWLSDAWRDHLRRVAQDETHAASAFACVDCDEPISAERRAAVKGVQRCAVCQKIQENSRRK